MRLSHLALALAAGALGASCVGAPAEGTSLALVDPLGIAEDAADLRALVFPLETEEGMTWTCEADGSVAPAPPEDFGAEVPGAVANLDMTLMGSEARTEQVQVTPGDYAILVQARGDDPTTGRRDVLIGTGCTEETIGSGETQMVRITLQPILVEGVCGDAILSPDEQCDDGGTADGDGCSASCRTEPMVVSVRTGGDTSGTEEGPAVAWALGQRMIVAYAADTPTTDIRFRLLDPAGQPIESPSALAVDQLVDSISGTQQSAAASVGGGRAVVGFSDFRTASTEGGDVRLRFFDTSTGEGDPPGENPPAGVAVRATATSSGPQTSPVVAARDDGSTLIVFENGESSTGLSARFYPAGSTDGDGSDAFAVGQGASGASTPALVATADGFALAFGDGDDVWLQRLGPMGMPADAMAQRVVTGADAMGTQDQPTVAFAPATGSTDPALLVAWREGGPSGDGDGSAVRARAFAAADASPLGEAAVVNTTTGGDQVTPSATGGVGELSGSTFARFAVTWRHGAGTIRGRMLDAEGDPAFNRQPMPSTDDFEIASGGAAEPDTAAGGGEADAALWVAVWSQGGDVHRRLFPLP